MKIINVNRKVSGDVHLTQDDIDAIVEALLYKKLIGNFTKEQAHVLKQFKEMEDGH